MSEALYNYKELSKHGVTSTSSRVGVSVPGLVFSVFSSVVTVLFRLPVLVRKVASLRPTLLYSLMLGLGCGKHDSLWPAGSWIGSANQVVCKVGGGSRDLFLLHCLCPCEHHPGNDSTACRDSSFQQKCGPVSSFFTLPASALEIPGNCPPWRSVCQSPFQASK